MWFWWMLLMAWCFCMLLLVLGVYFLNKPSSFTPVAAALLVQDGFVCVDELNENEVASNASRIMQFAKAMHRESQPVLMPHNKQSVSLRIGIHTGPLVSGLVGSKMPKFTLFGEAGWSALLSLPT